MARAREKGQENPGDLSRYRAAYVVHIRMPCLDPLPLFLFSLSSSRSFLRRAFVCSTSLPFGVSGDCSGLHLSFIRFKPPSPSCTLLPCLLSFIDRVPLPFFRRIPFLETLQPLRQLEIFFPPSQRKKELLHPPHFASSLQNYAFFSSLHVCHLGKLFAGQRSSCRAL
jgi:hypothetical protein